MNPSSIIVRPERPVKPRSHVPTGGKPSRRPTKAERCPLVLRGQGPAWDNQDMVEGLCRRIPLTQAKMTWVDAADFGAVSEAGPWCARKKSRTWYAQRTVRSGGRQTTQSLHVFLTGFPQTDHKDGDGLNNRRSNLRPATTVENNRNRRLRSDNTSGYKGVYWHKQAKCWRAKISVDGKYRSLGCFYDVRAAARAYDKAALEYYGEFACTNVMLGLLPPMRYFRLAGHPLMTSATGR
jgi:AP2 domain